MICSHCNGTGDLHGMGYYDCTNCDTADQRIVLNAALAAMPPMTGEDMAWVAYQAGVLATEKRHADDIAELVAHLRTMWGHAVELGTDDCAAYWIPSDEDEGNLRREWLREVNDAYAVVRKYKK